MTYVSTDMCIARTASLEQLWSGKEEGTAGVGVFVVEEWIEKIFEVQRVRQNHLSEAYSQPFCLCMPHRVV